MKEQITIRTKSDILRKQVRIAKFLVKGTFTTRRNIDDIVSFALSLSENKVNINEYYYNGLLMISE